MVAISYEVKLDTKRDNTFNGTYDDISDYVINDIQFGSGFTRGQDAYSAISEPVATPAQMLLYLDNSDGVFNQETLGSEVLSNGSFATWSSDNPSSWTVTGESGTNPEVSQVGGGEGHDGTGTGSCNIYTTSSTVSISQATLTTNNTYRLTISIGYRSVGTIAIYSGATRIAQYGETGTFTEYFVASSATLKIENLTASCNISIDDISIKQVARYTGLLRPGSLIRLRATYGSTQQLFIGKITYGGIRYGVNNKSANIQDRMVTITVQDAMNELGDIEYIAPLQTNVTTDEVLTAFFESSHIPWPYYASSWMLGISGASELDYTTYLFPAQNTDFETGKTTLTFAGDAADSGRGVQAQQYIRETLMAEAGGRFYFQPRTSTWMFINRHHDIFNDTSVATIASTSFEAMDYRYGDDLVNSLVLNYTIKNIGADNTILWASSSSYIRVEASSVRRITGRYLSASAGTRRIGGYNFKPITTDPYVVTSDAAGTTQIFAGFSVQAVGNGSSVTITIDNANIYPIYVFTLIFRGTPLVWYDEIASTSVSRSIKQYDQRTKQPLNIKMIDTPGLANDVLTYLLSKYNQPTSRFDSVTFLANQDATRAGYMINRTIDDRITITHSDLNHNADYIIIGEQHRFNTQSRDHYVTWYLKPVSRETAWVLNTVGKAELGINTRLGL